MTTSDHDDTIPARKHEQLAYSIKTLLDEFGRARPMVALAINLAFIALGVGLYLALSGWVAFAGAVLAIWSALAILKWVIQA